jgi:hypothetical protein
LDCGCIRTDCFILGASRLFPLRQRIHSLTTVVLPKPGGAETSMSGKSSPSSNCSNK